MDKLAPVLKAISGKSKIKFNAVRNMQLSDFVVDNTDEESLYIFFVDYSVPVADNVTDFFEKIYETSMGVFAGLKDGMLFVTERNYTELNDSGYYTAAYAVMQGRLKNKALEDGMIEACSNVLDADQEKVQALLKEIAEEQKRLAIEKVYTDFTKSLDKRLDDMKARLPGLQSEVQRFRSDLIAKNETLMNLMKDISTYDVTEEKAEIRKQIEAIVAHKKVVDVMFDNGWFIIYTTPLNLFEPKSKKKYYLGKMVIKIKTTTGEIRFDNLDNKRRGFWSGGATAHPHVDSGGVACFGNIESQIADAFTKKQYYILFCILIGYLETCNTDDVAGAGIRNWDVIEEAGKPVEKKEKERHICSECEQEIDTDFVDFYICEDCGAYMHEECACYDDEAEVYLCSSCLNRREEEREDS